MQVLLYRLANRNIFNLDLIAELDRVLRGFTIERFLGQVPFENRPGTVSPEWQNDVEGNIVGIAVEHPVGKYPEIIRGQVFARFLISARSSVPGLRSSNRTELPHMTPEGFHCVGPIIQLPIQSRMHAGQVIALKIIVNVSLPVAFHVVRAALEELHSGKIEAFYLLWKYAQAHCQGLGIGIQVYENQVEPLLNAYRCQGESVRTEIMLALEFGSADQGSIQPVGPTVVAAAEELARTASFRGRSSAMAANIVKTA